MQQESYSPGAEQRWNSSTRPLSAGLAAGADLHAKATGASPTQPPSPLTRWQESMKRDGSSQGPPRSLAYPPGSPPQRSASQGRQRPSSTGRGARRALDMSAIGPNRGSEGGSHAGSKRQASPVRGRATLVGPRPTRPNTAPRPAQPLLAHFLLEGQLQQTHAGIAAPGASAAISPRDSAHSFNNAPHQLDCKPGMGSLAKHQRVTASPRQSQYLQHSEAGGGYGASGPLSRAKSTGSSAHPGSPANPIAQPSIVRRYLANMLSAPVPSLSPAKRLLLQQQQAQLQAQQTRLQAPPAQQVPGSPSAGAPHGFPGASPRRPSESSTASLTARCSELSSHGTPARSIGLGSSTGLSGVNIRDMVASARSHPAPDQASMHEPGAPGANSTCSSNITVTTADVVAADVVPGYTLEGMVGEGGFCQVRAGRHTLSGQSVAIKVIERAKLKEAVDLRRIQREVSILSRLSNSTIIRLLEVVETRTHIYLVMELAQGGSLLDYVRKRKRLSEAEACSFLQQIVKGLTHCHQHEVIHRDVKLENILLDGHNHIKLIDFGLAAEAAPGKRLKVHCGSPSYAAPEIVGRKQYDGPPVDVWSLGVVLYAMICGHLPFHAHNNKKELCQKILKGVFSVPAYMSAEARDLLARMLTVVPEHRITFQQVLRHKWVKSGPLWQESLALDPFVMRVHPVTGGLQADEQVVQALEQQGALRDRILQDLMHNQVEQDSTKAAAAALINREVNMTAVVEGMSPALQTFLQADAKASAQAPQQQPETEGDLKLGELDITTSTLSLAGIENQIEQFADHDVLKAILDQGCDTKEYGRQYEGKLRQAELESIQDYITESDNLAVLHEQISSCDHILATMEDMLGKFQADLGNISTEIRALQEQSQSMSVKLKNRKGTEQKLGQFIDSIAIPGPLVEGIMQSEIDDSFQEQLLALHRKLNFLEKNEAAQFSAAYRDVAPELEKLRVRAVGKARDCLMQRIYSLRKPKTNIQILQQNVLLKCKYLVTFLRLHGREVFTEVRAAYVDTLSRVLSSHFRAYLAAIDRLKEETASQSDVVGQADAPAASGVMSLFQRATASSQDRADVFALGDRAALLHHLDQAAIIPHVADSEGRKYPYEILFRSANKLLMDTATSEFLFCADFFSESAIFHELFSATLNAVETALATSLQETWDIVCVLLMIRITHHHQLVMNKRRIPCLDDYFDRVNLMLWPRFKALFDVQLASIKHYSVASFSEDSKLHFITYRYAQLTASLLQLNTDYQEGQLDHNIDRMRYTMMDLLTRLGKAFRSRRASTVFSINNFNHVVTVLRDAQSKAQAVSPPQGATAQPQEGGLGAVGNSTIKEFEEQLVTCTSLYVEEQLQQHFGGLIGFVKRAEASQKHKGAAEGTPLPGYGAAEAAPVIKEFNSRWQGGIEALHKETAKDFKNSAAGKEVLKAAVTQLLLYYTRMLELLKRSGPECAALIREAVTVPTIMYSIKSLPIQIR